MRTAAWVALAGAVSVGAVGACGSSGESSPTGGGAGGVAGVAAKAGGSGQAGKAGAASGAAGAIAGGAGGTAGAGALVWTKSAQFLSCEMSVGLPSPSFQLFAWTACVGQSDCEEAQFLSLAASGAEWWFLASLTHDVAAGQTLTLQDGVGGPKYWTDANGAVRSALMGTACAFQFSDSQGDHFAAGVVELPSDQNAAVAGTIGAVGLQVWHPPGSVHDVALGSKRFLFRSAFAGARSLDATTGEDFRVLTSESGGVFDVYEFQKVNPEKFLFEAMAVSPSSPTGASPTILVGDGLSAPTPWLSAADAGEDATIRFAGTHAGWVRGFGQKAVNNYDSVEIWSSEVDTEGNPVSPKRLTAVPGARANAAFGAGGEGMYAVILRRNWVHVCDLAASNCRELSGPLPPDDPNVRTNGIVGVTRTHLWITVQDTRAGRDVTRMFRLKL